MELVEPMSLPSAFLPVAQFMPGFEGGSFLGCAILMFMVATYVAALIAVAAGIWSLFRPRSNAAELARWTGAATFVSACVLVMYFSWAIFLSESSWIETGAVPAPFGLLAWALGVVAAVRVDRRAVLREVGIVSASFAASVACTLFVYRHYDDHRARRDALFDALSRGNAAEARRLLKTGLDPDLRDFNHKTLLMQAETPETAEVVLAAGANVNADPRALALAAQSGNLPVVRVLLAHGANPNAKMGDRSPSLLAFWKRRADVLEVLRQSGATDAAKFQSLSGALLAAVKKGDAQGVKSALAEEYLPDDREAALKIAAERGDAEVARQLAVATIAYGEVVNAAWIAAKNDHVAAFEVLIDELERRQPGYVGHKMKAWALDIAAKNGSIEIARLAIARGWDTDSEITISPAARELLVRAGAKRTASD